MTVLAPYTAAFRELLAAAEATGWRSDTETLAAAIGGLPADAVREAVAEEVRGWTARDLGARDLLCRETATHYKWFIGTAPSGATLWLHDYRDRGTADGVYAQSIHDHRYSLASWVLRGGYVHRFYGVRDERAFLVEETPHLAGQTYVLDADVVHSVAQLERHTLTLVFQAPVRRSFSTQFFDDGRAPRVHPDFCGRLPGFADGLPVQ